MSTRLPVEALAAGFYGSYRNAGEEFAINDRRDFSGRWMLPIGWDPDEDDEPVEEKKSAKGKGKTKEPAKSDDQVSEAAQAALDKIASDAQMDTVELETFKDMKDVYVSGEIEVEAAEAVKKAFAEFEGDQAAWNGTTQKDRKERILLQVQAMVAAAKNAKSDEGEGEE